MSKMRKKESLECERMQFNVSIKNPKARIAVSATFGIRRWAKSWIRTCILEKYCDMMEILENELEIF